MDISDLHPAEVLAALYNRSKPLGSGFLHYTPEPMTREEAQSLLDSGEKYFDYLHGRVMKVQIDGSGELKTGLYNRDNGPDAAEHALAAIVPEMGA